MGKGYYEDEEVFKYVDEFGISQSAHKKDAFMFEHECQPERSKREDSLKDEMRCSEHGGDTVREVQ